MTTQDVLFGYMGWIQGHTSVAALLVTNRRGFPVEFRYTEPVEISEIQRLLHPQGSLIEALAEAVGRSLWNATERKPRLLLVEDVSFVRFWEELPSSEQGILACVEVAPNESYHLPERKGTVVLPVESGSRRLLRAHVWPERPEVLEGVRQLFAEASEKMRLDEPFERVETVLKALHRLSPTESRRRSVREREAPELSTSVGGGSSSEGERTPRFLRPGVEENPTVEPELSREAIQERLRRYGIRNETHMRRLDRFRAAAAEPKETLPVVDADVQPYTRRSLRRPSHDDDTDLEIVSPYRSETEVQRWKERFRTFQRQRSEEPEFITPDFSRIPRSPRPVETPPENISHLTKIDTLRTRSDLQWLKNRQGRS